MPPMLSLFVSAFIHADPQRLDTVIGGPRMWERRPSDPDFLDVRLGIGVQQAGESAVSLQWPDVPDDPDGIISEFTARFIETTGEA